MKDIEKKMEILGEVLSPVLSEQELSTALDIWEKEFSNQAVLIPSFFLTSISLSLDIANRKDAILNALMRNILSINLIDAKNKPGNNPKTIAQNKQHVREKPVEKGKNQIIEKENDSKKVVFYSLLENLISQFTYQKLSLVELKDHLIENISDLRLSVKTQESLIKFSKSIHTEEPLKPINYSLSIKNMSDFLDLIYSWICDTAGPVSADKLFSEAIKMTESLAEARDFPPKKLF